MSPNSTITDLLYDVIAAQLMDEFEPRNIDQILKTPFGQLDINIQLVLEPIVTRAEEVIRNGRFIDASRRSV